MARAKQTARSEARRRHRLANRLYDEVAPNELGGEATGMADTAATTGSRRPAQASKASAPPRPGVLSAFRGAYHPAHIREDLRDLPKLLLNRAFLAGSALVLGGAALETALHGYSGAEFLFTTLTVPPAMAAIFVAGFFAPKASYLTGALVGVLDAVVYIAFATIVVPNLGLAPSPDAAQLPGAVAIVLLQGAITGAVFASAAAWYRRFLALSSPKRAGAASGGNRGARAKSGSRR